MKKILIIFAALAAFLIPTITYAAKGEEYTITFYCAACNSPKHSDEVALKGSRAYIGSCASNEFPLGSTIYVEGIGELFVNDRMKYGGKIDVYLGNSDVCRCSGKFKANARRIN